MKKHLLFVSVLVMLACSTTKAEDAPTWSQKMVESHGIVDFYMNRQHQAKLADANWDYVSGLVANAVLKAWIMYPEKTEYYNAVKAFADRNLNADGTMILNAQGGSALRKDNIDDLPAGRIFFALYEEEKRKGNIQEAERYKTAATLIRNTLKHNHARIPEGLPGTGGFYHKAVYPNQMWLDGLYMGSPIYAQWEDAFGQVNAGENTQSWNDIALQFKTVHQYTYNPETQLNYHAWSAQPNDPNSFWANKTAPFLGASAEYWGRGMGWYFAALADVLEYMPQNHPEYNNLLQIYQQVAAGLKRWQDPQSGVWYQLLQYDVSTTGDGKGDMIAGKIYNVCTAPNYLEASASSMFTYAYLKGIRLNLLDKGVYQPVAEKAYQGVLQNFIRENNSKTNIIRSCASAGLGPASDPSRTGRINYYLCGRDVTIVENEGKAIGPFIMASLEHEELEREKAVTGTAFGIAPLTPAQAIEVYPNPGTGKFTIDFIKADFQVQAVQVYDSKGRHIRSETLQAGQAIQLEIDLTGQQAGLYLVLVQTKRGRVVKQVSLL